MEMISDRVLGAAHAPSAAADVKETPGVRRLEDTEQSRPADSIRDEYIPEEKQEPSGRYWPGTGEDGELKVYFDDPERSGEPERSGSDKHAERCTGSTDKVDREIEKLKKQKQELERQLSAETDETKVKDLEAKLAQVERELRQKDNDTYRRQHASYTSSSI